MTTTYVLSLTGDEEKAANATHWARFRRARLLSVSRRPADDGTSPPAARDSIVIAEHGPADAGEAGRLAGAHDPAALAALLVRTLDVQDGMGVVLADFDDEAFADAVVARIAALGRRVTCSGRVASYAFGARVRARADGG